MKKNFGILLIAVLTIVALLCLTACSKNNKGSESTKSGEDLPSDTVLAKYGLANIAEPNGTLTEAVEENGALAMMYTGSDMASYESAVEHYYTVQGFNLNDEGARASKASLMYEELVSTIGQRIFVGYKNIDGKLTDCVISFFTKDADTGENTDKISANTLIIVIGAEKSDPGNDPGGNVTPGGNEQGNDKWFTAEEAAVLGISGLAAPSGSYIKTYSPATKNGRISFDLNSTTPDTFDEYATVLFNFGFNQDYDEEIGTYTPYSSAADILEGDDTYKMFDAYKYVPGVCRVYVHMQFIESEYYSDKSISFALFDFSTRPEKSWFTASEAAELGFSGLDTFRNIANKTVMVSNVSGTTWKTYKVKLSGVAKEDAIALIEYFFDNGASISHYDEDEVNPIPKTAYDDEDLFNEYDYGMVDFRALFCVATFKCDVYVTWSKEYYDFNSELVAENVLEVELQWNTNHTVEDH